MKENKVVVCTNNSWFSSIHKQSNPWNFSVLQQIRKKLPRVCLLKNRLVFSIRPAPVVVSTA